MHHACQHPGDSNDGCPRCGARQQSPYEYQSQSSADAPGDQLDLLRDEQDLRIFVGSNDNFYIKRWSPVITGRRKSAGFNPAAFLLGVIWLGYRKLYWFALGMGLFCVVFSLLEDPLLTSLVGIPALPRSVGWLVAVLIWVATGFFANNWYLWHARRQLIQVRNQGLEPDPFHEALANRGGTSFLMGLASIVVVYALMFAVIFAAGMLAAQSALTINGSDLFYSRNVSETEARSLGEYLEQAGFFDGNPKTVLLDRDSNGYQFKMVIRMDMIDDQQLMAAARDMGSELSQFVFDGAPVEVHLCDDSMQTIKIVRGR